MLIAFAEYERARNLAEATIRNRDSILRTARDKLGKLLIDMDLRDLRQYLGRPGNHPGTRRTERAAMRAFFHWLVEDGYRRDDPTARLAPIRVPKGEPRPFTPGQIDAMLSRSYTRTRAMILLGYYQGFRVSSIARVRTLPLHPVIAELAETMPTRDWWFPARGDHPGHVQPTSVTDLITRAKKRAGITDPTLTPHSLRHAFGTDLVEGGVDIRVVQELMMHESLATTQIYTRVSERLKREGISLLRARSIPVRSHRRAA